MAQYKVPQDVEADDKLIGPFSFRQFVYLLIAGGCIAVAVGLFQLFPLLCIIPILPALFFVILALPLKKDQPMETYLAALVSYYLKPHKRIWEPGQRDATIEITAPKLVDDNRSRDISGEEATHRLSFLADIVDTGGYAIKGAGASNMREDLVAEANATADMFETRHFDTLGAAIAKDENERHAEVVREMKEAIESNENLAFDGARPTVQKRFEPEKEETAAPKFDSPTVVMPGAPVVEKPVEKSNRVLQEPVQKTPPNPPKPSIIELANNSDFSVATIAKEANRINRKDEGEVFISLH